MTIGPEEIRAGVAEILAHLPDLSGGADISAIDIDAVATQLEHAHTLLAQALESVEKR